MVYFFECGLKPNTMSLAIVLFLTAALFGFHLLKHVLKNSPTPKGSLLFHSVFAAAGLAILIYHENKELTSTFYLGLGLIILSVVLQMGKVFMESRRVVADLAS